MLLEECERNMVLHKYINESSIVAVVAHIAQRVKGEGPYMDDLNSTLVRHFFEGVDLMENQNQGGLVGSHVCTATTLNQIISGEELDHYKWYYSLILGWKCVNEDVGPKGEQIVVSHSHMAQRLKVEGLFMDDLNSTIDTNIKAKPRQVRGKPCSCSPKPSYPSFTSL